MVVGVQKEKRPCRGNWAAQRYFCLQSSATRFPINTPFGSLTPSILSLPLSLSRSLRFARALVLGLLFRFSVGLCDVTASTGYAAIIHEAIQLRNYENSGYFILLTCAALARLWAKTGAHARAQEHAASALLGRESAAAVVLFVLVGAVGFF